MWTVLLVLLMVGNPEHRADYRAGEWRVDGVRVACAIQEDAPIVRCQTGRI